MSTTRIHTETNPPVDEETRRIIEQRLTAFEEDRTTAVDAKEAWAAIRQSLERPSPR